MQLRHVITALEEIAPPYLAEDWDNTGLLLDPPGNASVKGILLTIDLSEAVVSEAVRLGCQIIVAYHPILFNPIQHLRNDDCNQRVVMKAIREGISVYSPHTALDAVSGGVNDWLSDGIGPGSRTPIIPGPPDKESNPSHGQGRLISLKKAVSARTVVSRYKRHLSLTKVRAAFPKGQNSSKRIRRVAVCAGAGSSVLSKSRADMYVTGEMKHHDILDALSNNTIVVLSEHTHTERGYLPIMKKLLSARLPQNMIIRISKADREPVQWI